MNGHRWLYLLPAGLAIVALAIWAPWNDTGDESQPAREAPRAQETPPESPNSDDPARGADTSTQRSAPAAEEARATAVVDRVYTALGGGAREAETTLCGTMTAQARRQTIDYARAAARVADGRWSCEEAVRFFIGRSKQVGAYRGARGGAVVDIETRGDRATATVRIGPNGRTTTVPLVRQGGEWKLSALGGR